jgi:hypothetical protein
METFVPPSRDAFSLALGALRQRLRQARDAPGEALPIQTIAQELRLSPTPVREALSRLAGEDLVDKRGPTYTRPRLDAPTLVELYRLRLTCLNLALSARGEGLAAPRRFGARTASSLLPALTDPGQSPAGLAEGLWLDIVLRAQDLILAQTCQRLSERLAPFNAVEDRLFEDGRGETMALAHAFEADASGELRRLARAHHRRRMAAAPAIIALAGGAEYRTNIV